jgi:hypothetical protein
MSKSSSDTERALRDRLLAGTATLDEGLRLYSMMTSRGAEFPLAWEELVLRLGLAAHPDRRDLLVRLRDVLALQEKPVPAEIAAKLAVQEANAERHELKPGIFIVTLPKSGSVFIQQAIQRTAGLKPMVPSHGYFPVDMLNVDSVQQFQQGGFVSHSHCDASEFNLRILDFFGIDWVLHLRDPRAALLSWTHHVERPDIRYKPSGHLRSSPAHPDGYFDLSFAAKVDWQIGFWLPGAVKWM